MLHFDVTRAVEPLEITAEWEAGEVLETFPFAVRTSEQMTRRTAHARQIASAMEVNQ